MIHSRFTRTLALAALMSFGLALAMAASAVGAPRILYAPADDDNAAFRSAVSAVTGGTVDYYDARSGTPDGTLLASYDCVYTWPNAGYADATLMGNNLADFVDAGGRVVLGTFCAFTTGNALAGRIMTSAYSPVTSPSGTGHFAMSDYAHDGGACMYSGIPNFGFYNRDVLALQGAGVADGHYADGELVVAYRPDFKVLYVNAVLLANTPAECLDEWPRLVGNACVCTGALATLEVRALPATRPCSTCGTAMTSRLTGDVSGARGRTNLARRAAVPSSNLASGGGTRPNLPGVVLAGAAHSVNVLTPASATAGPRILYAPSEADDPTYRASLATATGGTVDYFDARSDTPSPALLAGYDAVYTWVDYGYANNDLFGDRLADFVDAGGKVVMGSFCAYKIGNHLGGRIMSPGYSPVCSLNGLNHVSYASAISDASGCSAGITPAVWDSYRDWVTPQGGGLAEWHYSDGEIAVARRPDSRVIYTNGCGAIQLGGGNATNWVNAIAHLLACGSTVTPPTHPALLGCSAEGELFQIDTATGKGSWIGNLPTLASGSGATEITYDPVADRGWLQEGDAYPFDQPFDVYTGAATGSPVANGAAFQGLEYNGGTYLGTSTSAPGPSMLYAPSDVDDPTMRAAIASYTGGRVDYFDASACTPTPALLAQYDCVYTWVNNSYADRTLFGDRLADFVDAGHQVILGSFCTYTAGNSLGGRIMTAGYSPVTSPSGSNHASAAAWTGTSLAGPCLHDTMTPYSHTYRDVLTTQGAGVIAAKYTDGEIAAAFRPDLRVVYSNGCASERLPGLLGDWARLVANAALCAHPINASSTLQTLDPSTGTATPIGATGFGPITGLASNGGVLYGLARKNSSTSRLVTLDPGTGAGSLLVEFGFDAASLEVGPDLALYGGGSKREGGNLYRIDPGIAPGYGTATLLGPTGFTSVTGLARIYDTNVGVPRASTPPVALGLEGARPNPSPGGMHVAFTLPRATPARLELLDVAGRVVRSRDVGALGAGAHVVDLTEGRSLPVGVYLVHLAQDGVTLSRKAVVLSR